MKNTLNEPERSQSQALYYKVKAAFQFSPQGEMGMTLTPALSRPTGEGELFAGAREDQSAVFVREPPKDLQSVGRCFATPEAFAPPQGLGVRQSSGACDNPRHGKRPGAAALQDAEAAWLGLLLFGATIRDIAWAVEFPLSDRSGGRGEGGVL